MDRLFKVRTQKRICALLLCIFPFVFSVALAKNKPTVKPLGLLDIEKHSVSPDRKYKAVYVYGGWLSDKLTVNAYATKHILAQLWEARNDGYSVDGATWVPRHRHVLVAAIKNDVGPPYIVMWYGSKRVRVIYRGGLPKNVDTDAEWLSIDGFSRDGTFVTIKDKKDYRNAIIRRRLRIPPDSQL